MLDAELLATPEDGDLVLPRPCSIYTYDRNEATRAVARASRFRCTICGTPMTPVFPAPFKDGRRRSPRPYFRAVAKHYPGYSCRIDAQPSTGTGSGVAPGRSARRRAPNRFIDEVARESRGSTPGHGKPENETQNSSRRWAPRIVGTTEGTSTSAVRHVRDLVAVWHADPASTGLQRLAVPRCPGRSYSTVFKRIDAAAARELTEDGHRFLYWAPARRVAAYASGFALRFPVQSPDQRWLRAFIHRDLEPTAQMGIILERLDAAARGERMTVYLLGAFVGQEGRQSLTLEPTSARYVWLEPGYPGEAIAMSA